MHWTGIILSAGGSTRMGQHKAMLEWEGEPIVAAHCRAMANAGGTVLVVLGAEIDRIRPVLPEGVAVCVNADWATTQMADSLRMVLNRVTGPVLVTPVDVPPAPVNVLKRLTECPDPTVLRYQGVDGHPVWIDAASTRSALSTRPLKDVLSDARRLDVDWPGCTQSWNTPAEWSAQSSA